MHIRDDGEPGDAGAAQPFDPAAPAGSDAGGGQARAVSSDIAAMTLLERLTAAAAPDSAAELLELLAKDEHLGVREAVARNPATPVPTLMRLSGWFPHAVLHNRRFAALVNDDPDLPQRLPESALVALLRQPEVPQSWLQQATTHSSFWVRHAVAQHPAAPVDALMALAEEVGLRAFLAKNPSLPTPLLTRMAQDTDPQVRATVARHPGASDATRAWLLQDRDAEVRRALAENPRCEPALLGQLAADEEVEVRRAAAHNPAFPPETRDLLQRAGSTPDLLDLGSYDPALEPEVLAWLSQGGYFARLLAARHPNTPADALVMLRGDNSAEVRRQARRGPPSLPPFAVRSRPMAPPAPPTLSKPPAAATPPWLSSAPTMLLPRIILEEDTQEEASLPPIERSGRRSL